MKKILFKFIRIFTDKKEYFIKCTIMSVIAAFILGLAISLVVPSSAAGEPIESDQVIIPAGTYRFNDVLTLPAVGNPTIPIDFNVVHTLTSNEIAFVNDYLLSNGMQTLSYDSYTLTFTFDSIRYFCDSNALSVGFNKTNLNISPSDSYAFSVFDSLSGFSEVYFNLPPYWGTDYYLQNITVLYDTSVDASFASWFFDNTQPITGYIIEARHYYAKDSINGGYFHASDDSIDLRYYDPFSSTYVDAEGMIFTIENDMALIYYGADEVFVDGWQMDAFQSIEILSDASVDSNFYNCFFGLYSLSDADSNSYNVGFADGYIEGRDDGYAEGYNQGYHQGLIDNIGSSETFLGGVVENVLDALDKLVIVGNVSILDILKTVIGAFVVIFFLKLIAGG